jgi:hypothetical protein
MDIDRLRERALDLAQAAACPDLSSASATDLRRRDYAWGHCARDIRTSTEMLAACRTFFEGPKLLERALALLRPPIPVQPKFASTAQKSRGRAES